MISINTDKTENAVNIHKIKLYEDLKIRIRNRSKSSKKSKDFQMLFDFLDDERLLMILTGNLFELISISKGLSKLGKSFIKNDIDYIFNYEWFRRRKSGKNENYNAFDLASNLSIDTCPYCNCNYTVSAKIDKTSKRIFPAFDHFLPQKDFPILALSFFNLIPVCNLCNTIKNVENPIVNRFFYPYHKRGIISEFRFHPMPISYSFFNGDKNDFELEYNINDDFVDKDVITESLEKFAPIELYNKSHKGLVSDFIVKSRNYNSIYRKHLMKRLNLSDDEIFRIVFESYYSENDFYKRPFSKLKRDIFDEINMFYKN